MLTFDFKAKKVETPEKYPNIPVLTYLGSDGTVKFQLNKKAVELLEYKEDQIHGKLISFGRDDENNLIFIANTTNLKTQNQSKVNLDNSFSNAKFLERLQKSFDLEFIEGIEFLLTEGETANDGFNYLIIEGNSPLEITEDIEIVSEESEQIEE